jgi:hypothetical protein
VVGNTQAPEEQDDEECESAMAPTKPSSSAPTLNT